MLPQGYTRVEYIESTGTQWLNTNVVGKTGVSATIDFEFTSISAEAINILGSKKGNIRIYMPHYNSGFYIGYGNAVKLNKTAAVGERHQMTISLLAGQQSVYLDGQQIYTGANTTTYNSTLHMYLFGLNSDEAPAYLASIKLYACQIYDNGTLIRDYIPCQTDTGEVGLYDMETATFYGNAGTGEFVAGGVISGEDVPDVPEALEYTLAGDIVALTWSASSGAETYRVYRDGALIVETEATGYTDTVAESPVAHVYAVTAVNEYGESALSEFVHADIWGDTAPELIYDRTQADVNDAKALISKYMRGEVLDGYEQEKWERGLRGCYNTSDVNRVEYHTRELQNILNANGYNIQIDTQLWAKPDIMRYSDIVRYLGNINAILDAFGRSANAPKLPGIDRWIDYIAANDIEKILYVTRELVYGALAMFRRAGTFAAGNDYVTQVIRRA